MRRLFSVDISSFAVAGALVIFLMALEMILDITIFKNQGPIKEATLVPVVFPLIAGAGSFTTLLSLKAEFHSVNIITALVLNMLCVYIVIRATDWVERKISASFIYLLRKFFGIILLAISVRLFTANFMSLIHILYIPYKTFDTAPAQTAVLRGAAAQPFLSAFSGRFSNGFSGGKKYVPCILKYV